ncbi:MAG: phage Gp37/Gp68 family protein [Methylobacillus sp.]|jgi:protein gp37|nr:phage Gp37/Gp68 family protein [Methylobacillus sp.]
MTDQTKIEWADSTFNPWIGCIKISPACDHCYAAAWDHRFAVSGHAMRWGAGKARDRTSAEYWKKPPAWNRAADNFVECSGCGRRGDKRTWMSDINRTRPNAISCCPERKLIPTRRRVFCGSLCDVFDNEVPPLWRQHLMSLVADTPNLDWLFLTKRIGNAQRMLESASMHDSRLLTTNDQYRPLKNLWLGITVCNQEEADRDIPKLLAVPAAKRFLSVEPVLSAINLRHLNEDREINEIDCLKPTLWGEEIDGAWRDTTDEWEDEFLDWYSLSKLPDPAAPMHEKIDWVICGGESGPHARPMHPDWPRSLRDQCVAAGTPFFFKQWGEFLPSLPKLWPHSVTGAHHVPTATVDGCEMVRVGKKHAGRSLDGRKWNEVPS